MMSSGKTAKPEDLQADVVVIGGGGAGMAAAAAAAENGARVIVLEKRGLGGSSAMAFGVFAVDTPDLQDGCFQKAMDWAHWRINPRIVRAFINKSGDTVRWLKDMGVEFDPGPPGSERQIMPRLIKGQGIAMIKVLAGYCRERGVRLLIRTPARKILTGERGAVTGVLVGTRGSEFTVRTKSVIVATGGFAGNRRLLKKYCPDYHQNMERIGVPNAGDGFLMATQAGAATEGLGPMLIGMPKALHPPYDAAGRAGYPPELGGMGIISLATEPRTLRVNGRGQRFYNEAQGMGEDAIVRQPGNVCYTLFDREIIKAIARTGPLRGGMPAEPETPEDRLPGLENAMRRLQAGKDFVEIFDSLEAVSGWMGLEPAALRAEVDKYNADCERGRDPLFAKDRQYLMPLRTPPYYVIRWSATIINTIGGIKINERTEVLDKQDKPIPGLYAAGVDSGGWESPTYCWLISGHAFGFSVYSGRIAGENAARFVKEK